MKIESFEDIKAIDSKLACLFLRQDEAVKWINAINGGIKEWIERNNKQYWEVVRFVTWSRGILGVVKKDKKSIVLTRENFARVLLKFCPDAVTDHETIEAIKASMEHYPYTGQLKNLEKTLDGHFVRHHIRDVEALLDSNTIVEQTEPKEPSVPTLEEKVEKYCRTIVDEKTDRFPCSKVCVRPQYNDITPALSIETYESRRFLHEGLPSGIVAFEFIRDTLQMNKLYEFIGQYSSKHIKLFIVSSKGLLPEVRALAFEKHIGYVRLNPKKEMTSENFELPRSIEDYSKQMLYIEMLKGKKPINIPQLVMDDSDITPFLADVLREQGVSVKSTHAFFVPYISPNNIEDRVESLIGNDVQSIINKLRVSGLGAEGCSINPNTYATSLGLTYSTKEMEGEPQLGKLNVKKKHITLYTTRTDAHSMRFTMAHELGHYVLHSPLFKEKNIVTVGETSETLSFINNESSRWLECQANMFASNLLMPKKLVVALYGILFKKYVQDIYGDSIHPLYYNPKQRETWNSYNNIVRTMAMILDVSQMAMDIRLQSLGLLKIGEQNTHVSNFLFSFKG